MGRFREAEPSICLFNRKERRDGEADGRERWPCLLSIRTIMSDDEGATEGGRGAKQGAEGKRGEGQQIEVKDMEGWRNEMLFFFEVLDRGLNEHTYC